MRLINCTTLELEEFFGDRIPQYAILSHTWQDKEVIFTDLPLVQRKTKAQTGYRKIEYTCAQARADGLNYAWVDTCCIDKRSSAELSEAINSMFAWYKNSAACYAYLSDVREVEIDSTFPKSRWFRRGWTLQELLAPKDVIFYDQDWNSIGKRSEYAEWISEIAGIGVDVLSGGLVARLEDDANSPLSVAKKMSWASCRETTRLEDIAYCLLGIFDVNMPPLYGEGARAFVRLQEEIIRRSDDDSILAWGLEPGKVYKSATALRHWSDSFDEFYFPSMLASSPKDFSNSATLEYNPRSTSPFALTNVGLQIELPLISIIPSCETDDILDKCSIGLLSCSARGNPNFLGILLCDTSIGGNDIREMSRLHATKQGSTRSATTIELGPRAATTSLLRSVIISTHGLRSFRSEYRPFNLQVIVEESNLLQELGYRVKKGAILNILTPHGLESLETPEWDPETRMFTLEQPRADSMIDIHVKSHDDRRSKFTIFLHTVSGKAIVREGKTFTRREKLSILEYLQKRNMQGYAENITLPRDKGTVLEVAVSTKGKAIYHRRIFTVVIEAVKGINGRHVSKQDKPEVGT